jgi:hypothetical protein
MYAAAKGDPESMRLLLDAGADIFTIDNVQSLSNFRNYFTSGRKVGG